jgi:hypothetical protein
VRNPIIFVLIISTTSLAAAWMSTTLSAEAAQCIIYNECTKICRMDPEEEDNSASGDRDVTWGNTGNNRLSGGFGDDILYGAEGDDWFQETQGMTS